MKNQSPKTSRYNVFEYWKDKCITENGEVEIAIGYKGYDDKKADIDNSVTVIEDWGEPQCWACGHWLDLDEEYTRIYDKYKKGEDDSKFFKELWNDWVGGKLERCHIVPRTLGAEDLPNQLFLMCNRCHRESPDTIYPKEFFKWVYARRKEGTFENRLMNETIKQCGKFDFFLSIAIKRVCDEFFYNHQRGALPDCIMNAHEGRVQESSTIAAAVGLTKELRDGFRNICNGNGKMKQELALLEATLFAYAKGEFGGCSTVHGISGFLDRYCKEFGGVWDWKDISYAFNCYELDYKLVSDAIMLSKEKANSKSEKKNQATDDNLVMILDTLMKVELIKNQARS